MDFGFQYVSSRCEQECSSRLAHLFRRELTGQAVSRIAATRTDRCEDVSKDQMRGAPRSLRNQCRSCSLQRIVVLRSRSQGALSSGYNRAGPARGRLSEHMDWRPFGSVSHIPNASKFRVNHNGPHFAAARCPAIPSAATDTSDAGSAWPTAARARARDDDSASWSPESAGGHADWGAAIASRASSGRLSALHCSGTLDRSVPRRNSLAARTRTRRGGSWYPSPSRD